MCYRAFLQPALNVSFSNALVFTENNFEHDTVPQTAFKGQIIRPHFDGQSLFCFSHLAPEMRRGFFQSSSKNLIIGCFHTKQYYDDLESTLSYSSRIKCDCLDALACASIAWEAFARICCFAKRDVSIVYSASKIRERAIFMLSTIL